MARKRKFSPTKGWAWVFAALAVLACKAAVLAQAATPSANVLTLDEAVERALVHAPGVVSARRSMERGALNLESAEIAFKPKVSASAGAVASGSDTGVRANLSGSGTLAPGATWSVSLSRADRTGSVGGNEFQTTPLSTNLSVNVRLWPPGRDADNWRTLESREFELASAEARLVQAERSAIVDVIEAYGRLGVARGRLALAEEALENAQRELELQRDRRARGMASEADVIRAEIAVLEQEGAVSSRRQNVDSLTANLARLVGLSAALVEELRLEPVALDLGAWAPPDEEAAVERATEVSLAVASQARSVDTAIRALDVLRRQGGPTVSVSGSVSAREGNDASWTIRLDGSYDLFDSGARANRIAAAERDVAEAKIALDEAIDAVRAEVASAYREIASSERAVAIAAASLELRKRELEVGREQVARGFILEEALRRIERDVRAAELDYFDAQLNLSVALLNLKTLLGMDP